MAFDDDVADIHSDNDDTNDVDDGVVNDVGLMMIISV